MESNSMAFSSKTTNFLVGTLALVLLLYWGQSLLIPLFTAALLSFAVYPIVQRLEQFGWHPILALAVALLFVLTIIVLILVLVGVQINNFIREIPSLINRIESGFIDLQFFMTDKLNMDSEKQINLVRNNIMEVISTGTSIVRTTITTTSNILFYIILLPIYMFFMIYYRHLFRNFILDVTPEKDNELAEEVMFKVREVVQEYIGGLFIVTSIIAVLNSIGLLIVGIKYAVFLGCFTALLTIIPYFGVSIGAIFTLFYTLLTASAWWYPIGVIIVYLTVQFLEGNFITPYIIGYKVRLNPLAVIVSLLAGGFLWGGWGLILSVPIIAVLKMVFDNIKHLKPYGRLLGSNERGKKSIG